MSAAFISICADALSNRMEIKMKRKCRYVIFGRGTFKKLPNFEERLQQHLDNRINMMFDRSPLE